MLPVVSTSVVNTVLHLVAHTDALPVQKTNSNGLLLHVHPSFFLILLQGCQAHLRHECIIILILLIVQPNIKLVG